MKGKYNQHSTAMNIDKGFSILLRFKFLACWVQIRQEVVIDIIVTTNSDREYAIT